ncbi:circadian clock protein KaiC [Actinopolymorpha sp. B17G11]|uniref:circadian clock protein KaiC n=1 Tax=Actinopolymorpha sp. B17G11 TaxID=3160861 RepID=UPI0032E4B07A
MNQDPRHLARVPTGISGFDELALGGLPAGRSTLVTGTAGSGKTLFALEFLARGIQRFDEPGVFVTFEENPDDVRTNAASLGLDVETWEKEGKWAFVDASQDKTRRAAHLGPYDFGPLIARIEHAIRKTDAHRVALDSMAAILTRFTDVADVRDELFRVASALDDLGVVTVITAEKSEEYDTTSRHGVEEFVHSNVITMRNVLEHERRRRTIEILKFRGAPHRTGEWLFAIDPNEGILVLPLAFVPARHRASRVRISSGIRELDVMCGGGFFQDALVLLTGPTGAGKTLTCLQYASAAVEAGERCLFYTFDETREQLGRSAASWGMDLDAMERSGKLKVVAKYPEMSSLEDHFSQLRHAIADFDPARLVIDTLSALERVATPRTLLDFLTGLGSVLRQRDITTLLTALPPDRARLMTTGSAAIEVAGLTDVTIRLHYFEAAGENQRTVSVVQARGTAHDERIRRVTIDETGLHIGRPVSEESGWVDADSGRGVRTDGDEDAVQ